MSMATSGKIAAVPFDCPDCAWLIEATQIVAAKARMIRFKVLLQTSLRFMCPAADIALSRGTHRL
jgi:hypothetical protein